MTVADLYDERRAVRGNGAPDRASNARRIARQSMTPSQKALDNLLHLPDIGERLCKTVGRRRPELYLMDKHEMEPMTNAVLLTEPGYRHVAHLLGGGLHA